MSQQQYPDIPFDVDTVRVKLVGGSNMAHGEPGADGEPPRCDAQVYPGDAIFGSHRCANRGKVEENGRWRCGVHSNATKDKRRAKSQARYDKWWAGIKARSERDDETERRAKHYDALREALGALLELLELVRDEDGGPMSNAPIVKQARAALDTAKEA